MGNMTYDPQLESGPNGDEDAMYERCVHGVDVDLPCEDCSPENIPGENECAI